MKSRALLLLAVASASLGACALIPLSSEPVAHQIDANGQSHARDPETGALNALSLNVGFIAGAVSGAAIRGQ